MSKEKREEIEAFPIGPFRMMKCDEEEVRELEADYTKLQEDLSKAVELLKEIADLEKYVKNKVTILGGVVSLANDFLNQLDKDKG